MVPVLAAGSVNEVADLITRARREPQYGWSVEAACVPTHPDGRALNDVSGVPVVGGLEDVPARVQQDGYRVVVAVPHPAWTRTRLRDMAWDLEGTIAELVVAPALMEVDRAAVALHAGLWPHPPAGQQTVAERRAMALKAAIDRIDAVIAIIVLTPLLLAVAAVMEGYSAVCVEMQGDDS